MKYEISSLLPNAGTLPGSQTEANPASASPAPEGAQGTQEPDWDTFYARLKARQKLDAQAERDRDLDRFARSPECGENDATFDYLDTYCEKSFGIRPNRGNYFNTDLGEETSLKPFASAERYLNALMLIKRHGYEAIASDRYRAATKAEATGDLHELARTLGVPTEKMVAKADGAHAFFDPGMAGIGNAMEARTDEEIEEDVKHALARVKGENFIAMMRAVGYDFDDDDKALLQAALAKGDGMPAEFEPHLASVFRESPEKAARLVAMIDRTRKVESDWLRDVVWRPLWTDGIWRAAKNQAAAITDALTPAINFAAFDELVRGSSDSAKYYWNDDERAEYARLVDLARTRHVQRDDLNITGAMFGIISISGTPLTEEEAKRHVDDMCARRLAREAMPRDEQIRQRREQLLLEDAVGYKPMYEYSYANRAIAGALSSVGYMATSSVGMGVGFTLNTLAQFQSIRDDMIRDGLDPDTALGAQIFSATVWSAIEKAQFPTAFGKPLTGLQRKVMAMRIASAKGAMGKFAAIGALARNGSKELLVSTLTESIEEGLQGGVEGFTRSALWTGDYGKAFADAVRQAGNDFVESLGSMALIAGVGTGWKAVTSNRQAKSYESLADFAAKRRRAVNAVTGKTYAADEAIPKDAQRALDDVKETLKRHGGDITSALDELRERIGLDEKGLREVGDYLDLQAAIVEVARQEKDAKTALRLADFAGGQFTVGAPGSRLDVQALYDIVLPGTKVEDVEIPDTSAAPAAPVETPELSAAREAVAAAQAEVDAAKVGSARRGAERKLRKEMKKLKKAEAAAAAAAPKPTRKVQKVTLPTGASYILERDTSAPDVHTSSWAQSVAQAMEELFADPALGEDKKPSVDGRDLSLDAFKALPASDKLNVAVTTEQYLAMTKDERESYCRHWGLAEGGHTRILDESGRELLGADGVVTIKDGFRKFVHRGGNWELAHEHGHFIAAVAAKRMTPEQIATMRRLFGAPTAANELWNEENANNQFAEWLRGKYDFKVSTRAERRAKMNWFQRALDTVKHVFWLSGERPPVAPVEREMREKALDAAFNALRSGDFSGLDVYAGIDFAEDHAGKDGNDAAPDALKPAATASEKKAGNPAPKAEKGATEAPKPVSEAPAPATAAKTTSKSPKGGVATAASADFQAGYDAAIAAMNANPVAFADGQSVRTGGKMTVFTPDYSMKVEAEAMWTPLASLVESTDDREVQMRDRTRAATDEQTHSTTRPGVFQPLALFPGSKSDDGAPIVGGGNRIISGHGRKRMLDILAKEGRFGEYLDVVAAEAAKRGFAPPPDGMENPVLVLRVTGGLDKREDLVRFAELSNRWGGLERSGAELAESDARKITDALLRLYAPDASGNLLAASNRPFMAAFLKAVGATGLTNADGTPTPEAALRVQRAFMTAVFGNDEKIRSMVQSLLERSQELSLASLQNALMRSAGRLLAMKRHKGSFDIVSDVREAAYQYIAWRVAQQKSPKLTLAEHLRQGDFLAADVPPMQQALARLLEAERFGKVLEKYNDIVAQQAVDAQSTFGFFEAKTPLQLIGEAERALLAEGETPVTPDPASPEAAAPAQKPPAVQAEPAPTPEAKTADPVEAAQAEIAPPEPETFVPVPAVRGTATLPGPGAEGVKAHQVNADGMPKTDVRTLPPGAWNLLRAPYDVRRPPKPSAQDRAGRGLGISAPPPATDSQGRNWGKVFPHFQGNKAEMADRTSQAIRRTMTKAERDHYTTVVDYFGGGGCWGLYHALTNFENARQLVVNEFDPDRLEKIRLLHEIDGQVADEAEAVLLDPKVLEELRTLASNSSAPVTIANKVDGVIKRRVSDGRVRAVLQAFIDCAHTMLGSVKDKDGNAVDDTEAGVRKALEALREDGRKAKEAADAFKARGGSISYRSGDAAAFDDAPSGHQVVAVCDPPYYLTQDYQQGTILGLDLVPDNWSYAATLGLLHRLADTGSAIIYTDEAWWNKDDYANAASDADMGGLFGSGILDEIAKSETFRKENDILLDIINTLDHFDVAGRVAGRQEVLGVHHGHERNDEGTEDGAGRDALRPEGADYAGGERGARTSVRRMAGDLEGEGRAAWGTRPHRGREGRVAIAREVIVQDIASSVEEASPASDPAAVDALVRHSVRSVREDRMASYAKTVSTNAKAWLKRRADDLDKQMAAAGYTEKVWHGTYGEDFNTFKFSANSHDVPAAYFTYNRGTAQNYAALTGMDFVDDEANHDNLFNTRQFYVNPGKVLDIDEAEKPSSLKDFIKKLQQAYEDGYNAVRVRNALDDQGARLDEFDNGPMTFLEADEMPGDGEGNFQTDILIVMQQPGDNAPARIKAADPVTFMDELPIPLDMRADHSVPDVRYSVAMGSRAKEEARAMIAKYRPDVLSYTRFVDDEIVPDVNYVVDQIAAFDTPKESKAALFWFCKGTIRLPDDRAKVVDAIKTAERAKVDPFKFELPGELLEEYAKYRPGEPPTDPDTVPELTDRREMGHGIVTYLVQDDKAGQAAMRKIINTHFGKDASPWCLLQGDKEGNLTSNSWNYWQQYNAMPKRVAFKDGKLVAFMATDISVLGGREEAEMRYEEAIEEGDEIQDKEAWILKQIGDKEQWWDRTNAPHDGIPFTRTSTDAEGAKITESFELMPDGKVRVVKKTRKHTTKDGLKIEERWRDNQYKRIEHKEADGIRIDVEVESRNDGMIIDATLVDGNGRRLDYYMTPSHEDGYWKCEITKNDYPEINLGSYVKDEAAAAKQAEAYYNAAYTAVRRGDPIPTPPKHDIRFSVASAWANSAPMTAREIKKAVEMFGTTSDTKEAAYITPDGEWLNYEEMGEHFEIRQALSQKRNAQLYKLQIDKGDATPYIASALKGGLVRILGGIFTLDGKPKELGVQFTGRPDAKTLNNVERFFDAVTEQYPDAKLTVEGDGWTRMYAPDESARLMRDIRNFAKTGETPPEPSVVSQFHTRFSVTTAWRHDFPKAVCMTTRAALMEKHGDLFRKAKAGGVRAAAQLVKAVVKPEKIAALIADHPDASIVCPVYAEEATGRNKIPRAFAKYIAKLAGIETDQDIMQSVRAFHSGATAGHRLFVSPEFEGKVTPGAEYILVDDHITQGGTVNALRDHIEANGGKVVAIAALTLSQGSSILSPRKETLDEIKRKWPDIDDLLKSAGIAERADALTESQLRYILKFSTDTFRDRVAQAGREGGGQGAGRALRGREAASEGTPSEGVARAETEAERETRGQRERMRSSVRSWNSAGLANVATALFAQQLLAGKEVSAEEADSLLKNIGLGAIPAPELLKKAKDLAEQNREKVKRLVRDNAPELVDALVQSGLEAQFRDALDGAITGAAEAADPSVGREVQKAVQRHETRQLMAAKGFDAAQMMAELPIDLTRGILATADRVKTPEEIAKLEEARKRREEERAAADKKMTDEERLAAVDDPTYVPPSEESLALFRQLYDSAKFALEARQAEERRAAAEKAKRKSDDQQDGSGKADAAGSVPSAQADADALLPAETVARIAPVFDSPELFSQFLVEWTAKHVVERHPNIPSTAQMWKNPVAIRELKQTATGILRKLARDCLGSPSLNYARNLVDHQINELESDAETRTYKAVLRKVAYIYDAIHENALRIKRRELVNRLVNGYRTKNPETGKTETVPGIRQLAGVKGRFSAVKEEFQRAIDARTEVWARQLVPLLTMGEEKLSSEIAEMERRLSADPTAEDYVPMDDDARREMADRLALAKKYGGLVRRMPGEIADAADEILSDLNGRRQAFEQRRLEREERCRAIVEPIVKAMEAGGNGFRDEKWAVTKWIESMQGDIALEMQNLVRFCPDPELRRAAMEAIDELRVWISEGESRYINALNDAQKELNEGLAACYGSAEKGIKHLTSERIPEDVAVKIFTQGGRRPTYGQLLQLYASAIQSDYRENAEKHGRTAQLPLMEQTLTDSDRAFHAFAVEWHKRNRRALSDAVEEVTGLPVTSPDALYCRVCVKGDPEGIPAHVVAWSPVPAALNRRVRHGKDFDESAEFFSVLAQQCKVRAQAVGLSMTGILLRDTIGSREVRIAAEKHVGRDDIARVMDHVRDILVQDADGAADHSMDPVNVARKWAALTNIGGNISSALAQPASIPVWANVTLGGKHIGIANVARYMATVGTKEAQDAVDELVADMGFKARYEMGWSEEVANVIKHPTRNKAFRLFEKGYYKIMVPSKWTDRICSLWIAQGFYRDATRHFLERGEELEEAKRKARAITIAAVEATQQSGRVSTMNALQRKKGVGGAVARAFFQFKTAQLLTNNFIIQSVREVAARPTDKAAWGQLIRSLFIASTLVPAYMAAKGALWALFMGDEPPEEDPDKWPLWFRELCFEMVGGVTAPVFFAQQVVETPLKNLLHLPTYGRDSGMPAIDWAVRFVKTLSDVVVDAFDVEDALHWDKVQEDLDRLVRQAFTPYRHGKRFYDNRWGEGAR